MMISTNLDSKQTGRKSRTRWLDKVNEADTTLHIIDKDRRKLLKKRRAVKLRLNRDISGIEGSKHLEVESTS